MSSTLLEITRSWHEEKERLERLIVKDLRCEPSSKIEALIQKHRVRNMINSIIAATEKLDEIYRDKDNARSDEIAALDERRTASGSYTFNVFYDRLEEIREYHRQHHPNAQVQDEKKYEELLKEEPHIVFSGEESYGRYLDLHELYNEYVNSNFGEPMDYSTYLDVFSKPHKIARCLKLSSSSQYMDYLEHLLEYLISFFLRTEPLTCLDSIFSKVKAKFDILWEDGKIEGWESEGGRRLDSTHVVSIIDLDHYSTVQQLTVVGAEKLKLALAALGLKTGGTVQQRAERLFLTKNTPIEQLERKHLARASQYVQTNSKEIALKEAKLKQLCELLDKKIIQTKETVQKKQALTYEEIEAERNEEEVGLVHDTDSDQEEEQQDFCNNNNPLKLPMGWDGKPIPFWLYKLHGLGQEFKCEICGEHSYRGRRAFERHFREGRHQQGMFCLGIPNTKDFNEITSIQEAKLLWERIQERRGLKRWRPDLEEEYEDEEGNIYNKKTYTDLRRQGLIC